MGFPDENETGEALVINVGNEVGSSLLFTLGAELDLTKGANDGNSLSSIVGVCEARDVGKAVGTIGLSKVLADALGSVVGVDEMFEVGEALDEDGEPLGFSLDSKVSLMRQTVRWADKNPDVVSGNALYVSPHVSVGLKVASNEKLSRKSTDS